MGSPVGAGCDLPNDGRVSLAAAAHQAANFDQEACPDQGQRNVRMPAHRNQNHVPAAFSAATSHKCGSKRATPARTSRSKQQKARGAQLLPFRASHGGRRAGAGRKPNGDRAGVSHDARKALAARFPVHVTVKLREHLPPLRRRDAHAALRYVLGNARHHAAEGRMVAVPQAIDSYTSAPWFDGFRETIVVRGLEAVVRPVTVAHTWLLEVGWRRHGLLSVAEHPA
jgi:hypothetical protein